MIFVLLTYGGWNEAAYLSAEVKDVQRNMVRSLLGSVATITFIYLAVNLVMLYSLGLQGVAGSQAVAADLVRPMFGEYGVRFIGLLIIVAAVSTMNATIITGARSCFALGQDFSTFRFLGQWSVAEGTPFNALLIQGIIALALVVLGTGSRSGFETMIEYTAPVFWFFILLVGFSLFVLRHKEPHVFRPFRVPLYPLTPFLFCAVSLYMLVSSLIYIGKGTFFGVTVLAAGLPLLWLMRKPSGTGFLGKEKRNMRKIKIFVFSLALTGIFFFWNISGHMKGIKPDVPYVPTPMEVVDEMLQIARIDKHDILYDLGSGDGRIVITAAKRWGIRGVGIEIDPRLVHLSRQKVIGTPLENRVEFVENDLFNADIAEATVVTLYLLPKLNIRLRPKLLSDLRPGTRVVSHSFDMGDWAPDETRSSSTYWALFADYDDTKRSLVYLWIIPANINGIWTWESSGERNSSSVWIQQRFQKAEGDFSGLMPDKPVEISLRGDMVRIITEEKVDGRLVPVVFEGQVRGDIIEGQARQGSGSNVKLRSWKAIRQVGTLMPLAF